MSYPTNLRRLALLLSAACLTALCGCAKSLVRTTVNADGSWSRALKFSASPHDKPGMSMGPSVQEAFVLPKGAVWKTHWDRDKDNVSYVAETSLTPGVAAHHDVVVKSKKGVPILVNDASVHEISPGTWEYRETLHWAGPADTNGPMTNPEALGQIKSALPTDMATDDNAREIAKAMLPGIWQALWGPPEPLVAQIASHPDLGENLLAMHLGKSLDAALRKKFGDRLTDAQRLDVERKILASFVSQVKSRSSMGGGADAGDNSAKPADGSSSDTDDAQSAAMTFVVKVPGTVVSTNGEQNPITQEVFWGLYPQAAQLGDVTLTVTYKVEK